MKKVVTVLLFGTALAMAGCTDCAAADTRNADVMAIEEIWTTYAATRVSADAETWLALWDEGALKMAPGRPAQTLDEMRAGADKKFVPGSVAAMKIDAEETAIMGDWAFSRGTFSVTPVQDGKEITVNGGFMTVLKRQDDGSWKIYRDIMNFSK